MMTIKLAMAGFAAVMMVQGMPAVAQDYRDGDRAYDNRDRNYDNRDRAYDNRNRNYDRNHTYRGSRYQDCRRSNGTTGTIAGAVGGGVVGNVLGGGTLGTLAGAGGGALLGRTLDRNHDRAQNRRNGC